ncbi:MAG: hypothetical protein H6702_23055, partial [Myxococcales bacterium]|nr:hypothetical protein [Myxococcales bacterium]
PERGRCQPGCRVGDRLECPTHEACDPELRQCVQAACEADRDCPAWQFCQGERCFDGCREGECAAGEICDPESRLCVTLCDPTTHAPCGMGARCEPETRRCVPGCADDPTDVAGDADDAPETAPLLPPQLEGERRVARADGRIACPGDLDAYAFEVQPGERLQVTLTQGLAGGALRWVLRGPDGAALLTDQRLAATRQIRWPALPGEAPPGRYVASVEAVGEAAVPDYALRFEAIDARTGCFGDPRDPGDDRVAGATPAGRAVAGRSTTSFTGDLCRGDVDWFCAELGPEDGLTARLVAPPGCAVSADLRDRLLADRAGPYRLAAGEATAEGTPWIFEGPPASGLFTAGAWCLRVAAEDAEAVCEGYLLDLTVDRRLDACTDSQEPNDGVGAAVVLDGDGPLAEVTGRLPAGEDVEVPLADLQICEGDRDVFAFEADAGDALRAWLVADPEAVRGALQVRFLDGQGAPRGDPAGVNPPLGEPADRALAVAAGDGRFHVEISGLQASTGAYALWVRRDPGDGRCSEDLYETAAVRADTPELAADLTPREGPERLGVRNAAICHPDDRLTDVDWYRFDVADDATRLCLEAAFRHADGNLDVGLFWGGDERALPCATDADCDFGSRCVLALCREPLLAGDSRTDNELLPLSPAEVRAGPYLVRVAGDGRAQNGYDLTLTQVPPAAGCAPDWRERGRSNDQARVATELGSGRVQMCDAWLCHGERNAGDWYAIDVPAGQDRTVHVAFDPRQDGLVLMSAYGAHAPAVEVQSFELQTSVQCINVEGDPAEDRRVLIHLSADAVQEDGDARVDYTFQVVPTDLGRFPRGACDVLSGGIYVNVPWPRLNLSPAP